MAAAEAHYFVMNIDPVLVHLGPFGIRWYGLSYLAGFAVGFLTLKWLVKREKVVPASIDLETLTFYAIVGVILGGRLGEVLFYSPGYYFSHPLQIFAIWKGGMASHGGMLGVLIATLIFARRYRINWVALMDILAVAVTPGLFFGRVANFINAELVGSVTHVPWAVIFPGTDSEPRHPVQLYQALTEGPLLMGLLLLIPYPRLGLGTRVSGFMIFYGVMRFFTEAYREKDPDYLGNTLGLTNGQLLSVALVLLGVISLCVALVLRARGGATDRAARDG